jgi:uncharacterized protein YutE (UPF0331/DUF86 family)
LRHEYHRIEDRVIWNAVKRRLPALKRALASMRLEAEAAASRHSAEEARSQNKTRGRSRDR